MNQTFARFSMLVGEEGIEKLRNSKVIVFGVGGVGSYTVEALVRAGVGQITMVDFDEISESNINRQLHSLRSTIGKSKIDVMKDRILDINPDCKVELVKREKKLLEPRAIECINILEDIISLTISLDLNEKKNKLNSKIDNIIKEKQENKTLDEITEEKFKQKEFIENNIKNAELD